MPKLTKKGYVRIWSAKDKRLRMEHDLVWEKHYGAIPAGYQIHHKDGNKQNNDISNLQLVSTIQNQNWITGDIVQKIASHLFSSSNIINFKTSSINLTHFCYNSTFFCNFFQFFCIFSDFSLHKSRLLTKKSTFLHFLFDSFQNGCILYFCYFV